VAIVRGRLARIDGQRRSRAQSGHEHSNGAQFGREDQTKGSALSMQTQVSYKEQGSHGAHEKAPGFGIHADSRPNCDIEFQIVGGLSAARLSAVMHWKAQWECKRHATFSDSYCGQ